MTIFANLITQLSALNPDETAQLAKELADDLGIELNTVGQATTMAPAPNVAAPIQTEFAVRLTSFGAKKIEVIKVVREITGLGLKEAKDLVDNIPVVVKADLGQTDAEAVRVKLAAVGAEAVLV